jgi:transcriptional regulator with XRE-family HTH domain
MAKKPTTLRTPTHTTVIAVLVASRREKKLTQEDLAAKLGWHRSTVAKIETSERRLDVVEFIQIAKGLGVDPEQLFSRVMKW